MSPAILTLALLAQPAQSAPTPTVRIDKVWIALGEGDKAASNREMRAKLGADVRLYLVVEARVNGKRRVFTEAPKLRKGRRRVRKIARWPATLPKPQITWYKLEADPLENGIYDNTGTMEPAWHPVERADHPAKWHWCHIDVAETEMTKWGSAWRQKADAHPTTTPDEYGGLGTMRFTARVKLGRKEVWARGKEHMDKSGLKRGIATVRFRRDDTPVGYMTELINVPYVYGSSTTTGRDKDHQAERGVGSDCADMVIYGWRRAGKKQGYTWTGGLKSRSKRRAWVTALKGGKYRTADGKPIKFGRDVRVGDMFLWSGHVAVIAEKDKTGYLTPNTMILQTVIESTALIPFKKVGFGFDSPPFDIRRAKWDKRK